MVLESPYLAVVSAPLVIDRFQHGGGRLRARNGLANKVNKLKKFDFVHQTVSRWETVAGQMGGQGSYRRSNG